MSIPISGRPPWAAPGVDAIALAPRLTSTGGLTARHWSGLEGALRYRHIGDHRHMLVVLLDRSGGKNGRLQLVAGQSLPDFLAGVFPEQNLVRIDERVASSRQRASGPAVNGNEPGDWA